MYNSYHQNKADDKPYCGVSLKKIINANPVIDEGVMETLREFIRDRYQIHLNKDVYELPKPWTDNPVFLDVKFTNVMRWADRATVWLIDNVCNRDDISILNKLMMCVLFRLYNNWETAELIDLPSMNYDALSMSYNKQAQLLKDVETKEPDRVFFTSAFNTGGMKAASGRLTGEQHIPSRPLAFIQHIHADGGIYDIFHAESPKDVCDILMKYSGIGEFLSYQMFVDFTYIPEYKFSENHFTIAGPGCKLGLEHLFTDFDGLTHEESIFWLRDNWYKVKGDLEVGELMEDLPMHDRVMNVMSLENCFCELGKYIKCKNQIAEGIKPRARVSYDGGTKESSTPSLF